MRAVGSASDEAYSRIYVTLVSAINSAESQVHITNAYMVPDEQLLKVLQDAARRGVDVKLIVPSHTDFWAVFHAGERITPSCWSRCEDLGAPGSVAAL